MKIGASEEAAKLIASSPDQIKKFAWDGVNLTFNGSDLAAVDDPTAKSYFTDGAFKGLFVAHRRLQLVARRPCSITGITRVAALQL